MIQLIIRLLFVSFVSAISFSGCAKYQTLPINVAVDVSKTGNVYENNISITKQTSYTFGLKYWAELNKTKAEHDAFMASGGFKHGEPHSYIDKFIGKGTVNSVTNKYEMNLPGSQIILKLIVTPLQPSNKAIYYSLGAERMVVNSNQAPINTPVIVTSDLSKYPCYSVGQSEDKLYATHAKAIAFLTLDEGDYKISVESLRDIPEIKDIKTNFFISESHRAK